MDMRLMKSRLILTEEYNGHEIDEVQADISTVEGITERGVDYQQ